MNLENIKDAHDKHTGRSWTTDQEEYWAKRRWRWDEWGSPVGLGLAWALFAIPSGLLLYFLHLSGIL